MSIAPPAPRRPAGPPWRYLLGGVPCDERSYGWREPEGLDSPHRARPATSVFVRLVAATLRARFAFSLSGELPALGCVVVSHHDSYWDGVVAAALDPRVAPITSGNWRSIPVVGSVLRSYGVLWTDDQTVASATALVRRGAACWIAPRGFDRARENPAHLGAARICVAAGAPLVPMSLSGLARPARRPRSPAAIAIWPPVMPAPGESAEAFAERLEGLLPRSVY